MAWQGIRRWMVRVLMSFEEVSTALNKIIEDNITMKQELFILRQSRDNHKSDQTTKPPSATREPDSLNDAVLDTKQDKPKKNKTKPVKASTTDDSKKRNMLFNGDSEC